MAPRRAAVGHDAERALRRLATVLFTEKRPENDSTDLFGRISIDLMRCKGMVEAEEEEPPSICCSHQHHDEHAAPP